MDTKRYTIHELSERTGFTRRTIRYYVQEGLLAPPAGRGRGGFYYDSHLQRLLEIRSLQGRGFRLDAIGEVLRKEPGAGTPRGEASPERVAPPPPPRAPQRELWVRYPVAPGVEVHVSRETEEARRRDVLEAVRLARSILQSEDNGGPHG